MKKHPKDSKAAIEANERGGWLTARSLQGYLYDVKGFSKAEMAQHQVAWMDNKGLHHSGPQLPAFWANPYWEIIDGHMVMRWGPDIVNDEPLPSIEELEAKIAERKQA